MNDILNPDRALRYSKALASLLCVVVVSLILAGCVTVGPDYHPPELSTPDKWHSDLQGGLRSGALDDTGLSRWWERLDDAHLANLEQRAVQGNPGLREALARLNAARAAHGISRAALFPSLDASATAYRSRSSTSGGAGTETERFSVGLDTSWEIDLFGGVRRSVEAAKANLEATNEELRGVLVSLLAEVALSYIDVRTFQARLDAALANLDTLQESYEINRSRHHAGLISELAVHESLRLLENARARIPALEAGLNEAKNRLAVLLGETPGSLHEELAKRQKIPTPPTTLVIGIPAEALRHRPDVRQAERDLAAQSARIGVATADLYPKLSLGGTLGLEALSSAELFRSGSRVWAIGPSVEWNIFDAGAVRNNIKVQNARQEQALAHYESTILSALEEVENALVSYAKEQVRQDSLARAKASAERAEQLARDQYDAGLVGFNNVLDAQRSAILLRDEQAQSNGVVTANLVHLYKALGGGWQPVENITED